MIPIHPKVTSTGKLILATLLPTLFLTFIRLISIQSFEWAAFSQTWLLIIGIFLIVPITQPKVNVKSSLLLHGSAIGLIAIIFGVGIFYWISENTLLAWLVIGGIYTLLLGWLSALASTRPKWQRFLLESIFSLAAGLIPIIIIQIETHFSDEEFFAALESIVLIIFWLILRGTYGILNRDKIETAKQKYYLKIKPVWQYMGFCLFAFVGSLIALNSYQGSFFPQKAPGYPGVTADFPFICSETDPSQDTYQGVDVFTGLLKKVESMPTKNIPEYGFLALGTGDEKWALEFRNNLLAEAEAALFTGPVGSLKSGQHFASQRAYYYPLVRDAFPDLFNSTEEQVISDWFAAINQRAFTVEWIDWMYALAFRYWPQGPYENQEAGAGLLSLLELNGLADPELSSQNQAYLESNQRGWQNNFRMTDDAAVYQPIWIENAWYQSLFSGQQNPLNQELSFEWLKVLALPDASPLLYNHIGWAQYATSAYWGAGLLDDEMLLWLAGRALESLEDGSVPIYAQPGTEATIEALGISPKIGSCLVFGNSGLPTQLGPLAPDKIVYRSGWKSDDIYLLLNLRFSGWHRYKATNALVQLYSEEPLLVENYTGGTFNWLPIGRSLFRDKRIPRENLNGLLIEKTGLPFVLYQLMGISGRWAQDPPYYAEINNFEASPEITVSSTTIKDWHGWQHQRSIYFNPEGIVAVYDDAQGPENHLAAFTWHFVGKTTELEENRMALGAPTKSEDAPTAEVVFLPVNSNQPEIYSVNGNDDLPIIRTLYNSTNEGRLQTITVFLLKDFINANIELVQMEAEMIMKVITPSKVLEIPIGKIN